MELFREYNLYVSIILALDNNGNNCESAMLYDDLFSQKIIAKM